MKMKLLSSAALALALASPTAFALPGFDITINFLGSGDQQPSWATGAPQDFNAAQKQAFEDAAMFWENLITGYQGNISVPQFTITAAFASEDGEYNSLAYAAVDEIQTQDGFTVPLTGYMQFDYDDWGPSGTPFASGDLSFKEFVDSVQHEMGHALGFGQLFEDNNLMSGTNQYIGAEALAAYNNEFGQNATSILLEEGGGHWSECWRAQALGVSPCSGDPNSPDYYNDVELMTPYAEPNAVMSNVTLAAFRDMGYTTVSAVPEPGTWAMMLSGLAMFGALRRRKDR